jgi:formiminotetrahydrofolate cyclodeaminase
MIRSRSADMPIGGWIAELASANPTPGGGAVAALMVANGAALIEMVTNLTIGKPRYAEQEAVMIAARERATAIRADALAAVDTDERVFDAVMAAYRLHREDPARALAIQSAATDAARAPLHTAALGAEVIALAGRIRSGANANVVSDVAVAVSAARAGLESAAVMVEVNLAALTDRELVAEMVAELDGYLAATAEAARIYSSLRMERLR